MLKNLIPKLSQLFSRAEASGRWYPQPTSVRSYSQCPEQKQEEEKQVGHVIPTAEELGLDRQKAYPVFSKPRGNGNLYKLKKGKKGELLADYNLFVDSIRKCETHWKVYNGMTANEKSTYMAHYIAVRDRKLSYVDPIDKKEHKTNSALFYELSVHRTRTPNPGIHRRTRCVVVDNSAVGKEANSSGRLAYCIHVYKKGYRPKHMPHATLGDKILVAIKGEMKKAYVVGANTHVNYRKHGIPSTDTNNIVLLDDDGNPIGNRVLAPIPGHLLKKRDNIEMAKIVSLATKFV